MGWLCYYAVLFLHADVHFIKELILGDEKEAPAGFEWRGRGGDKAFLYDIVANKRNGIDVDKVRYGLMALLYNYGATRAVT